MQRKSNAIVFIGMTYPDGGILHFALLSCELYKGISDVADFYYASIVKECHKGCWDVVKASIPSDRQICANDFEELMRKCVCLAGIYDKVIIHTGGGWGQTKHFVKAQMHLTKLFRNRLILVGTTHSYRNGSWKRIPMSAFQYLLYRMYYRKIVFQCQYAADCFVGGNDLIKRGIGTIVPLGCEPFDAISDVVPPGIGSNPELCSVLQDQSLFKFVYLAAFRPGKMHAWLVKAMKPILEKHPGVRILLCGGGSQLMRKGIFSLVENEHLIGRVLIPGAIARNEVPWLLQHSNCAIVPSRSETFGHNFLEPMFAGLPVIGTRVGIGKDIIIDGQTGYGFSLNNYDEVRAAILNVISNPDLTRKMGQAALEMVKEKFTHKVVAEQLRKVYLNLLDEE